ncbi:MAG: hypothetical protein ABJA61_01555 [Caldimonas sp.]
MSARPPNTQGSPGWASLLSRSIGLDKWRDPVVLVDGTRSPDAGQPKSVLLQMRDELGARLLVHDPATQAVRNLYMVHKELRSSSWAAVEALPRQVTDRAQAEAEMLQCQEPSPLLAMVVDRLREVNAAADERVERERVDLEKELAERDQQKWEVPVVPEVSETSYDEYELTERSWVGTVPAGLDIAERGLPRE